jgi:hypothetical protein
MSTDQQNSLSLEEHEARALLLGRRYSEWAGAYIDESISPLDGLRSKPWLDAETLEEIHHDEKFSRIERQINSEADTR